MEKNYLKLRHYTPFYQSFVFIDTIGYIYKQVMKKEGIALKKVREYVKEGSPYKLIMCYIKRKDIIVFVNALQQIRNKAFLLGYTEYDEICIELQQCEKAIMGFN